MPIYEYDCHGCRRRVSLLVLRPSTAPPPTCPRCGGTALSRVMSSLLFEVTAADGATYAIAGAALALAAAVSCYVPARHATRLDVVAALREE